MRLLAATLLITVLFLTQKSFGEKAAKTSTFANKIDHLVDSALAKHNLQPTLIADEHTFLRRTYLSIGGRVPTLEEVEVYFASPKKNRRSELINQLLKSEAYVSSSYHFWADLLRINGEPGDTVSDAYELWVKDAIRNNKPYDQMAYELVSAEGKIWENGAVGYYYRDRGMPLDNMSNTVRVFLGTRLECAQCHNHPFDKWTQMDFFKMASFTYGVNTRGYDSPNRNMIIDQQRQAAKVAYSKKARELTGSSKFPFISPRDIKKYNSKYPEKTEIPESVIVKKYDKKTKEIKKIVKQAQKVRLTPHEKHGLSKTEFIEVVKQCHQHAEKVTSNKGVIREVINELYDPLQYVQLSQKDKNVELPHDYQYSDANPHQSISPSVMFGKEIDLASADEGRIKAYGKWMASSDNPAFTKVIANRMWKKVFGLGVFEPVDELTDNTVVSNPELLDYLVELMIEFDYDLRRFQEVLYNTNVYQRSSFQGDIELGKPYFFQGPVLRRMSAEQIWDSLVSLVLPEADRFHPRLVGQTQRIERVKEIYAQLEGKPYDEFLELIQKITPLVAERRRREAEGRLKLEEAVKVDDQDLIVKISKEINMSRRNLRKEVSKVAFPFLDEKVDGEELLLAMGISVSSIGDMMSVDNESREGMRQVMLKLPQPDYPELPEGLQAESRETKKARQEWKAATKNEYKIYRKMISELARASELKSPSRPGHFLRDFGQSDRETIENASSSASVPQALNLLNGRVIEALTNSFSVFGKRLADVDSAEEKATLIFKAMLTRPPTEYELKLVKAEYDEKGEDAYNGIVWALLNTQQFLFVE